MIRNLQPIKSGNTNIKKTTRPTNELQSQTNGHT
jgi:hypothetical protein